MILGKGLSEMRGLGVGIASTLVQSSQSSALLSNLQPWVGTVEPPSPCWSAQWGCFFQRIGPTINPTNSP